MTAWWAKMVATFQLCFIEDDRWKYIVQGLGITLEVTILALILGVIIGVVIAAVRTAHDQTAPHWFSSVGSFVLCLGNVICKVYTTVIRGTPMMIQLMIMYFVIITSPSASQVMVAALSFGINSGAYVSEIVRGGIMSIDPGQSEASRSLGMGYFPTMRFVIIPQAVKAILPALGNELIALLKETSIVTVIGLGDLTKGATIIQGRTFVAFMPLMAAALIYLVIVMILTWLIGKLERRLRQSDRH